MTPDWHPTWTNAETGKSWTPHGDCRITFQEQDDGSNLQTLNEGNNAPFFDQQLSGTFSRHYSPGTNSFSDRVGNGPILDIFAMLS